MSTTSVAGVHGPGERREGCAVSRSTPATVATLATVSAAAVAWRDALFALSPDHDPCPGFRPNAWSRVQANALDFIERHGAEAHRLGWTAEELFGVHPALGVIRVDRTGALMLSSAGRVLAAGADVIRYVNGLAFRRSFGSGASVPVWNFGRADAIHLRR